MLKIDGLKIFISRGDTGTLTLTFTGEDTPADGTVAKFALQRNRDSEQPLWEKELAISGGRARIPFLTSDSDYPRGTYYWGLRLFYENGDVYTPLEKLHEFNILPVSASSAETEEADGGDSDG